MRAEDKLQDQQSHGRKGMHLIFNQESSLTHRQCSSEGSYSSSDRSRSRSVSRSSRRSPRHRSRYTSSSSSSSRSCSRSRSRSHPRCSRTSHHSCCLHYRRSRSYSSSPRCSRRFGRRKYLHSVKRSSSRERYYRRSRRSRSRSSGYRRRAAYSGRFRRRLSPSPLRRSYRSRSKSPDRSLHLSQKDKMDLLNIARENAVKILGVEIVRCTEEQIIKTLTSDTENRDEGEANEDVERPRTTKKTISFSVSNNVAKPASSPQLHESKVTSRADSVGNRLPYGKWIPVKTVSTKKH